MDVRCGALGPIHDLLVTAVFLLSGVVRRREGFKVICLLFFLVVVAPGVADPSGPFRNGSKSNVVTTLRILLYEFESLFISIQLHHWK